MDKSSTFRARRRSAVEKRVLLPLQREIGAVDGLIRRKYLQEFNDAYRRYERVICKPELFGFCAQAGTLLVSDFHALDSCQFFLCELLEELASRQSRPVTLLLEAIFTRDQHIIAEWQSGEVSDAELKRRLRFDLQWGYEWEPFLHTLKVARELHIPILGADCAPRGNVRRISRRDHHAAEMVARSRREQPDSLIVVFFGESHLAPAHLPREVERCLPDEDVRVLLQNVDELYFRAAGESTPQIDALQVNATTVAVFNATPVEKWQSYRLCIERWREESRRAPDFTPLLYDLIDGLLELLHIDRYENEDENQRYFVDCYPEISYINSLSRTRELLERSALCEARIRQIKMQVADQGSCYIPELNLIVVHQLRMAAAARNIAGFVHHACRGFEAPEFQEAAASEQQFYNQAVEHAVQEFGARLLYPSQPRNDEDGLVALYEADAPCGLPLSGREHTKVLDCALLHRDYELHGHRYPAKPAVLRAVESWSEPMRELLATYLGELLGTDLYSAYLDGNFSRLEARALMFRSLCKDACAVYFALARRVRRAHNSLRLAG